MTKKIMNNIFKISLFLFLLGVTYLIVDSKLSAVLILDAIESKEDSIKIYNRNVNHEYIMAKLNGELKYTEGKIDRYQNQILALNSEFKRDTSIIRFKERMQINLIKEEGVIYSYSLMDKIMKLKK